MNSQDLILIDLFCQHHGIEVQFISTLKEYGLVEIIIREEKEYFPLEQLAALEKIIRLHYELEINLEGIDVIMNLLHQMDEFKNQLLVAQNKLSFFEKQ